ADAEARWAVDGGAARKLGGRVVGCRSGGGDDRAEWQGARQGNAEGDVAAGIGGARGASVEERGALAEAGRVTGGHAEHLDPVRPARLRRVEGAGDGGAAMAGDGGRDRREVLEIVRTAVG